MQSKPMEGQITVENRKFPRRPIQLPVLYAPLSAGELPKVKKSFMNDLGAGGVAMVTDHPLDNGQLMTLNLYLPPLNHNPKGNIPYELNECEPVTVLVRVAWSKETNDYRGYLNGLAFCDMDSDHAKRLKHFLVDYELDQISLFE